MLGLVDWLVFVVFLLLWLCCGAYQAFRIRTKSAETVLLGNRKMAIFPTALALVATYMSAVSLLGFPAEIFQFGSMMLWYCAAYLVVYPVAAYGFLPVFVGLRLTSAYEYLELRFNRTVRLFVSAIYVVQMLIYLAVVLYAPALALSSVSEIGTHTAILLTGTIATIYTTFGGAATVVLTGALQMLVIFGGLTAVVIGGAHEGFSNILEQNQAAGRLLLDDLRPDPRIRHSFWSLFIGGTFTLLTLFSANQMAVQRYLGMPNLRSAQLSLLFNIPINWLLLTLYSFCAFALYVVYKDCDPKLLGQIGRYDQLLPYFVSDRFSHIFGFSGLFLSAVYSAGLSTISGGVNALSAVIFEDLISCICQRFNEEMSENSKFRIVQVISLTTGVVLACSGLVLQQLASPTVLQMAFTAFGIIGGPILGIFILGMFIPRANEKGALCGLLASLVFCLWLGLGGVLNGVRVKSLPTYTFCNASLAQNETILRDFAQYIDDPKLKGFYDVSYQYYSLIGVLVAVFVAVPVSFCSSKPPPHKVRPEYFSPFIRFFDQNELLSYPYQHEFLNAGKVVSDRTTDIT